MRMRTAGFTLIELLVVIAIIGILAAMLFPVFARARESARKIQCLSNVKNIALAINMYLTDWDEYMPIGNMDRGAAEYFHSLPRASDYSYPDNICNHIRQANPYAREQVILDEYIKNREVWRCPSARIMRGAEAICPSGRDNLWYNAFADAGYDVWYGDWRCPPCIVVWPSGWGGPVTDSFKPGLASDERGGHGDVGVFVQGVSTNDNMHWVKMTSVQNPAQCVVVGDSGSEPYNWNIQSFAWPDWNLCGMGVPPCGTEPGCCGTADWSNCPWSVDCGLSYEQKEMFIADVNFRKSHTRHMGGSNLGFLDGHAKWFPAEVMLWQSPPNEHAIFENMCHCPCQWTANYCVDGKPV
jgi:prepilin-type N-terminal cleavage/methylation domain-containing protein/prepilin-type processing-associated H-X9-DG protein